MINLLGIHIKLLIGQGGLAPAPLKITEALQSVEVTHADEGRSGFQLTFQIGRSALDRMDYSLLKNPLLQLFNRVILSVFFGIKPIPIMDGIITDQQLTPSNDPGASTLTLTGKDISLMMDLQPKSHEYPNRTDSEIVKEIIGKYKQYEIMFKNFTTSGPLFQQEQRYTVEERTIQRARLTDLDFINLLAESHSYIFYIESGPTPGVNSAHWGPPNLSGEKQTTLSVNMGPNTNVENINFQYNGLAANQVEFTTEDGTDARALKRSTRKQLVIHPATPRRLVYFHRPDGMSDSDVRARAQEQGNKSFESTVTANGSLDALRYGKILKPRGLVDLRGAGSTYDGTYYVKSVTHRIDIRKGEYKQTFSLTREGTGILTPLVSV